MEADRVIAQARKVLQDQKKKQAALARIDGEIKVRKEEQSRLLESLKEEYGISSKKELIAKMKEDIDELQQLIAGEDEDESF